MNESILVTRDNKVVRLRGDGTWEYASCLQPSLTTLQTIEQTPAALKFFDGLFDIVGVMVLDTGEKFTCLQTATGIEFMDGLDENSTGYIIQIYAYQAERLANYLQTGEIPEIEQYRIVKSLYAPMASAAFKNTAVLRFMNNTAVSLLIKRRRVVHIELISPDPSQEDHSYYTLLGASKQWLLLDGHHGTPYRLFRMNYLDVIEMCKQVTVTMKTGGWMRWARLAIWYVGWRSKVQKDLHH